MNKNSRNWCGSVLALDLGEKRVGLAISRSGIIAEPYCVMDFSDEFYKELESICQKEEVEKIIIGVPKSLSGKINEQEKKVGKIAKTIEKKLHIDIELVDESFTTKIAESRFGKKRIDEEAATLILESYLDGIKK